MKQVYVWHGSGLRDPFAFRAKLRHLQNFTGIQPKVVGQNQATQSSVVRADYIKLARKFSEVVTEKGSVVICADGGMGASRVASEIIVANHNADEESVVIGGSDNSVYVAAANLLHGANAFYGVNLVDSPQAVENAIHTAVGAIVQGVESYRFSGVEEVLGQSCSRLFTVVPMCVRPMLSLSGVVADRLRSLLSTTPCCLMLEDNYPADDMNWIVFYEDLTMLREYIECLIEGGGILCLGHISEPPMSAAGLLQFSDRVKISTLVKEFLQWTRSSLPVYNGVRFGHSGTEEQPVVRFGKKFRVLFEGALWRWCRRVAKNAR